MCPDFTYNSIVDDSNFISIDNLNYQNLTLLIFPEILDLG